MTTAEPTAQQVAQLTYQGKTVELPIYFGTDGPGVLDLQGLHRQTGLFTFDPGFPSIPSTDCDDVNIRVTRR